MPCHKKIWKTLWSSDLDHENSSKVMKNIPKSSGYLTLSNEIFPIPGSEGQGFLAIFHIMGHFSAIAILVYRLLVAADTY